MKTFSFFTILIITTMCMGLTSCSKDEDNNNEKSESTESTVTITNNSSQTLTDISFEYYNSDDDEEGGEESLNSLEKGKSHKFELPENCDTWFIVCHANGVEYESKDYKSKSLTITDKVLDSWYQFK